MRLTVLLIALACCSEPLQAETRFSGYLKNYSFVQQDGPFTSGDLYSSQFSSRLMVESINPGYALQLHYEVGRDFRSDAPLIAGNPGSRNSYRLTDITATLGDDQNKSVTFQNLDRFNVQFNWSVGDLTVGRQPITFGSARFINPTDVFLPFDVQALNTEYRVGIDALRFQRPLGDLSELDVGWITGSDGSENSAYFLRVKSNISNNDIEFTAIRFSEQDLFGFGIESTLGPLGTWFEAARVTGADAYERASIGFDYGFNEDWFAMLELHYNGAGAKQPNDYLGLFGTPAYQAGGVFLLGTRYLSGSLSQQITPLASWNIQLIRNLDDQSQFTNLGFDYSITENLYFGLNYFNFNGDSPRLPVLRSEYGSNEDRLIANLRFYF